MSGSELSLLAVVVSFAGLVLWVYWPSQRERLESYGAMPLDQDPEQQPAAPRCHHEDGT